MFPKLFRFFFVYMFDVRCFQVKPQELREYRFVISVFFSVCLSSFSSRK